MQCFAALDHCGKVHRIVDLVALTGRRLHTMPHIHRILLENVVRTGGKAEECLAWALSGAAEIPFLPTRILMHDTTCGPALVDIAAMRSFLAEAGHDPRKLSPGIAVDVSTDHSIAVDVFGTSDAERRNLEVDYRRNAERYRFMKWAAEALPGFRVHPPGTGIMHTLNLERLATVVTERDGWLMPDTLIGTDSHTPMVNGIGVLGWGVGGIEAEQVLFGLPLMLRVPEVVGVRLTGRLREGVTATDLALMMTERLRRIDLSDRFVEFFGPGVPNLSAGDRAVVANMTPEFGANTGFFPVDQAVLQYLGQTGRDPDHIALVEAYCRRAGLWFDPSEEPHFAEVAHLDLGSVEVSVAGPRRPQDRLPAGQTAVATQKLRGRPKPVGRGEVPDGAVAIAAITSCTNTTDPRLLVAAGLLARKAREKGLRPPAWVKTSLAPGSPAARTYLTRAGLMDDLEAVGFGIVGYGCTTCIGNSGPLLDKTVEAKAEGKLQVAVLSGNRNFPGRVHPQLDAAFLASPPLVIAFALAGDVERDILVEELSAGLRLADLWPSGAEIDAAMTMALDPRDVPQAQGEAGSSPLWRELEAPQTPLYPWDEASTYLRRPPFAATSDAMKIARFRARPILVLGDDITTDHISPAGAIAPDSDAGQWLVERGENPSDLNVFASRRGNWEVMLRGLFTNVSVRNMLGPGIPAGKTLLHDGRIVPLWQAAAEFARIGTHTIIVAGERYGMGSSRDWAAKGASLLGVRAVLASGFERIHRSNLVGMGVLPLRLPSDLRPETLSLTPGDWITVDIDETTLAPRCEISVRIDREDGRSETFPARLAIETWAEVETLIAGGIMPMILRRVMQEVRQAP